MKLINILNTEELNKLFIDIKGIAECNKAGFTYDVNTRTFVSSGWCVARKETQNSFHNEGLWSALRFLIENKLSVVGGWYADGKYYFDAVEVFEDEHSATEAGYLNEQIAIFHLDTVTEKQLPERVTSY